ncbi:hypothetical protein KQI65_08540 [bacterium]|nr:hypothetical protein [bacterium]
MTETQIPDTRTQRFAHRLSVALVPPVVAAAVFAVLVAAYEHGSIFHRVVIWLVAAACSGGLQIAYVLYLQRMEQVTAYDVPERLQRTKPYLLSAGISFGGLMFLLFLDASVFVWGLMWCYTINTLLLYAINLRWKISAHMMGLSGPVIFLIPVFGWQLLWLLPLLVALGWARITLRSHDLPQVLAGTAAGVLFTSLQAWLLLRFVLPFI